MSQITKEINAITGTIIGISGKLIVYALVILLLVEGMSRGYAFGHEVFYATAMEPEPGTRYSLTIPEDQKPADVAKLLKDTGLIRNEYAVRIQMRFYDYKIYPGTYELNTSMTSKEILQVLNTKPEKEEKDESPASGALEEEPPESRDIPQDGGSGEPEEELWLGDEGEG